MTGGKDKLEGEPDLDAVVPLEGRRSNPDGTWTPVPLEQTKRALCTDLADACGGEDRVTQEIIEKANLPITWRDYNYWIMELRAHQEQQDRFWAFYEAVNGPFDKPETRVDRLGLRHLAKDDEDGANEREP